MFSFPKFKNPFTTASNSSNNNNTADILNKNLLNTNNDKQNILYTNYMSDGSDIKWEDTVEFTFPIKGGRVIKVYDADTITIASKLPFDDSPMYRLSVRLNGIDTPEMKGKGIPDEEKEPLIIQETKAYKNLTEMKYNNETDYAEESKINLNIQVWKCPDCKIFMRLED